MSKRVLAATIALLLPLPAAAQILSGVKVEPAQIKAGETVKITASIDVTGGINCGLRLHYGDGTTQDFKINQTKDVPLVVTRAYAQGGDFTVMAEPKTQGLTAKCGGRNQSAMLKVSAPPAAAAKAGAKPAAGPQCPQGWTLAAKSVSKKTGAFTCTAKPGTKLPDARVSCPGDLGYFENAKKGQLGCRP